MTTPDPHPVSQAVTETFRLMAIGLAFVLITGLIAMWIGCI